MSEGFLSRWARRKDAVRAAGQADAPAEAPDARASEGVPDAAVAAPGPADVASEASPDASADPSAASADVLAGLPSLDALTSGTDLSPFLRAGVPAALRNAALRRMWSLDPAIRDFVSEAREYAYDWNTPGGAPGFGPLLPGDDVTAMLKRLVAGVERRDEGPPDDEPVPDMGDAEPSQAEVVEAQSGVAAPPAAEALPQPDGQSLTAAFVQVEPEAGTVAETPPVRPRLRRHGGAMPA